MNELLNKLCLLNDIKLVDLCNANTIKYVAQRERIILELYQNGYNCPSIASPLNVSTTQVTKIIERVYPFGTVEKENMKQAISFGDNHVNSKRPFSESWALFKQLINQNAS
jgi:uncharacterized protein YerC